LAISETRRACGDAPKNPSTDGRERESLSSRTPRSKASPPAAC
jgi:hypothetical protein